MPSKVYDTQADFNEGTFVNCEATAGGKLVLSTGQATGTWTSPVYEALNWLRWSQLSIVGTRPVGTNVYYRFRSGASSAECEAADWSPYDDDMDADGNIVRSIRTYYLNTPAAPVGAFFQIEVTLEKS